MATAADPEPFQGRLLEERASVATQRQLMWWRFRKHKLAMAGAVIIAVFYFVAVFADFFAYSDPQDTDASRSKVPPQAIHWFEGARFSPHVYGLTTALDPTTFKRVVKVDTSNRIPIGFFVHGYKYRLLGLFTTDIHLIGARGDTPTEEAVFTLGTDVLGRDIFSRLVLATRTSLSVGLVGVLLSLILGVILGGISGYYGGFVDSVIQRLVEIAVSIPVIPLWMGLAAAMPRDWSPTKVFFAISAITAVIGWTELTRVVRGRFLQLRDEDFITAARLAGAKPRRLIFVHMVPLFTSHIIASVSLALPFMIIAETSLSFLGLGLRAPAISWGVMLKDAQNIQSVILIPWMMLPVAPVITAILAFNFFGDGVRDAADPYGA